MSVSCDLETVDRSSGESCLPGVRRLNETWRNASGASLPLARRGQSAERARATPSFGRIRGPGGDPGAGVALARSTLEQQPDRAHQLRANPFTISDHFGIRIAG